MKRPATLLISIFLAAAAFAARAKMEWNTYVQPNGETLTLTPWGDEHFHCYKDRLGRMFSRDLQGVFHPLDTSEMALTRSSLTRSKYSGISWESNREYRQLVILVAFKDRGFSVADPQAFYDSLFNHSGYNLWDGPGCIADYFRDQSCGQLNLQFDVYGPVQVDCPVQSEDYSLDEGAGVFRQATQQFVDTHQKLDYSVYDWNGDGEIEQVIYVYAGYSGNQSGLEGYIWPSTNDFTSVNTPDGHTIRYFSASGELWKNGTSCGLGLICHEYSHCFLLPDIYPTASDVDTPSLVDEWDLMDGGTFTNWGWCPPNYSPLEKMLMGWLTPEELTADTLIIRMKPLAEGGKAYLVRHTEDEFLLLENRQQTGWDFGLPGRGLVIYHIYYDQYSWQGNTVNNDNGQPRYSIIAADDMDYLDWYRLLVERGAKSVYADAAKRLQNAVMSSAAYPWQTDSTMIVNRVLSRESHPAARMYERNEDGENVLSASLTDITQHDDGTVSFRFHARGTASDVSVPRASSKDCRDVYLLSGQRLPARNSSKGIYIRGGKKYINK